MHGDPPTPERTEGGEDNKGEEEEKNGEGVTCYSNIYDWQKRSSAIKGEDSERAVGLGE